MADFEPITEIDPKGARVIKLKLNIDELRQLREGMFKLRQDKISTAIKQLMKIGFAEVVHNKKTAEIIETISQNQRKNWESGRDYKALIRAKVDPFLYEK